MPTATSSASKSSSSAVKRIPDGFHTITPHLVCAGAAKAVEFYQRAFGAVELIRVPAPDGRLIHACIQIGDSRVMLVDEFAEMGGFSPKSLKGTPVTLHVFVEDVDAAFDKAVKAGATVRMPVQDMFWGDRYGVLTDPFGHSWSMATHIRDTTAEEIAAAAKEMNCAAEPAR